MIGFNFPRWFVPASRRRSRGFSLVEMLTVIAIISIAFTSIAVALGICMREDRRLAAHTKYGRSLQRLSLQWRADVHSSHTLRLPAVLETTDGERIEYLFHADKIERRRLRGENVAHRDAYDIPTGFQVAIAVEGESRKTAVLTIRPPDDPNAPTSMARVERRFEAILPLKATVANPRRRRIRGRTSKLTARSRTTRRGAILVAALMCFLVISLLVALAGQRILQQFREAKRREQQWQSEWLAESGVRRAIARLRSDSRYQGETWNIAAEELSGRSDPAGGQVVIDVATPPDDDTKRVIHIQARYPADELRGVARHREFTVPTSALGVAK